MSLRKKVKRSMGKRLHTDRPNQVDKINEQIIKDGLESGAKSVQILHPTLGYRKFSMSRIQYMGGTQAMWNIIATTLLSASDDAELVESNNVETK